MRAATGESTASRAGLGALAILVGLASNKWALERLLAADQHIASLLFAAIIALFQLAWIGLGVWLLRRPPRLPRPATVAVAGVMAALLAVAIYGNLRATGVVDPYRERRAAWQEIQASEELLLALTPELDKLGRGVANLELPDASSAGLFRERVLLRDLPEGEPEEQTLATVSATVRRWQASGEQRPVASAELRLWRSFLDEVDYFEHARFKFVDGDFTSETRDFYDTELHFTGLARTADGRWHAAEADQMVRWQRDPEPADGSGPGWRIAAWRTDRWSVQETSERLFAEVLGDALASTEDLARARRSIHEEKVREYLTDPEKVRADHPYFKTRSSDFHPGISVVDLDRDGFDDLYVMRRWGANLLLRGTGDGSFEEIAAELGLDVRDHTSSALFADFDNDGDADVVLGRTLAPSLYLVNEGGRFVDRSSSHVDGALPCLASSLSAVDYDGDGLLDVYVSTFGAAMQFQLENDPTGWLSECLPEADREAWNRLRLADEHAIWNLAGPPNVMLRNLGGGRFETVRLMPDLYRNTFQSTWADYDGDGDPDVYLANDFAPNNLLRNDGGGRFTDLTQDTGTEDVGFGMGASWGDYDNDGRHDLYVSNMYSKAGRRITRQMPEIDPRLPRMSRGNSLLRNAESGFRMLSGTTPDTLQVENAGWSWGGQFADFDNDGWLDLYAASGFFTVPRPFELPGDL